MNARGFLFLLLACLCIKLSFANGGPKCVDPALPLCEGTEDEFACQLENGKTGCYDASHFCQISKKVVMGSNMPCSVNFENFQISSCLSLKFDITESTSGKSFNYLYVKAHLPWNLAEQYCQANGYNLVSFETKEEFDKVNGNLWNMDGSGVSMDKSGSSWAYNDPIGQMCLRNPGALSYWLGLYYDFRSDHWNYTDKVPVRTKLAGADGKTLDVTLKGAQGNIANKIAWRQGNFFAINDLSNVPIKGTKTWYPGILCKRNPNVKPVKWSPKLRLASSDNILGYKCSDSKRVILGPEFSDSQILNGKSDCPNGEDETNFGAPFVKASSHDKKRKYVLYPIKRSLKDVQKFCHLLPNIQSSADKALLKYLPTLFGETQPVDTFWAQSKSWSNEVANKVLLGPSHDKPGFWKDNTKVNGKLLGLTQGQIEMMHNPKYYTYLNTETGGIEFSQNKDVSVYLICQNSSTVHALAHYSMFLVALALLLFR